LFQKLRRDDVRLERVVAIKVFERRNFGKEVATAEPGKEDLRKHVALNIYFVIDIDMQRRSECRHV
jgi:hypothetical protein